VAVAGDTVTETASAVSWDEFPWAAGPSKHSATDPTLDMTNITETVAVHTELRGTNHNRELNRMYFMVTRTTMS